MLEALNDMKKRKLANERGASESRGNNCARFAPFADLVAKRDRRAESQIEEEDESPWECMIPVRKRRFIKAFEEEEEE